MKRSIVLFVLLSAFVVGVCMVNAACGASLSRTESDDVLDGIQKKIELAMNNCFVQNTAAPLDSLFTKLNKLEDGNGMVPYWKAYITYYKSVFYLKLGKKEDSGKVIKEASAILNDIGNKTSETYALLALVQSFSIQFASGMEAGRISAGIRENAGKALELDSTNVRGWYVLGSNDYYTPASFGGGKKVEYYLKKATSSPDKNTDDSSLPTWGREYAYALLIQYYMQNDRTDEAKNCLLMAEKEYPDSYFIVEYKRKLDE